MLVGSKAGGSLSPKRPETYPPQSSNDTISALNCITAAAQATPTRAPRAEGPRGPLKLVGFHVLTALVPRAFNPYFSTHDKKEPYGPYGPNGPNGPYYGNKKI